MIQEKLVTILYSQSKKLHSQLKNIVINKSVVNCSLWLTVMGRNDVTSIFW
jgi:hypothetical protein